MASILISTWGSPTANAYATAVEVNSYVVSTMMYIEDWQALDERQLDAAILSATRDIEGRVWRGGRYFAYQALKFPTVETGMTVFSGNAGGPTADFFLFFDTDAFLRRQKDRVQRALAEQAYYIAMNGGGTQPHRERYYEGIRSISRGTKMSEGYGYGDSPRVLCPNAADILRYYKGYPRLVRGDAGFDSHHEYLR